MINHIAIIGLGLMGGSFVKSIQENSICQRITAYDRDDEALHLAQRWGLIDTISQSITEAIDDADLIMVATPISTLPKIFTEIAPHLQSKTVVTDMSSSKISAIAAAKQGLGYKFSQFVPGHPITGSNKHGISAANPKLFENRPVILTPTAQTDNKALALVQNLWHSLHAKVLLVSADQHDERLALTSHLPHLLASCYLLGVANHNLNDLKNAIGGGFRDFTRIGESLPSLWRDIFLSNKEDLLKQIALFQNHLNELSTAITNEDSEKLEQLLQKANKTRAELKDELP